MNPEKASPMESPWMVEYQNVGQRIEEGFRRYFTSKPLRLWLWYLEDRVSLKGFQLLWGEDDNEKAITWNEDNTFSYKEVSEEGWVGRKTQVLNEDAGKVHPLLIPIFERYAANIDKEIVDFIIAKIMESAKITKKMIDAAFRKHPILPPNDPRNLVDFFLNSESP
jgi:hypothetical protein